IGRFDTFSKGGIYKSNHLIKSALEELGHSVVSCDSQAEGFLPPKGADAAIIYPGDPNRPDFEHADQKIKAIRESGIPVLVNLSYNTKRERSAEIVDRILQYNSDQELPPVYLMTFTDVALSDSALSQISDFIVPMPKTITGDYRLLSLPEFDEREGIVLGDAAKLCNLDITGIDIRPYIAECKKLLPHVKLYAFKQYGGSENIPGIEAIPYMKEGFLDWVAGRRLFVCLNTITTFEMTPTEAQFVGTPVVYRPMPQSLSEYVGRSGVCVTSPQEFAQMCAWLYNDKFAWTSYSKLALSNSATNDEESLRIGIETSLRRVVFKIKAQK
ncbi:MAG: hypothetical protein QG558_317, partial [Campylobacterota bacterium]|nr:hypothetical protein [Campylobacterota bacterium]